MYGSGERDHAPRDMEKSETGPRGLERTLFYQGDILNRREEECSDRFRERIGAVEHCDTVYELQLTHCALK